MRVCERVHDYLRYFINLSIVEHNENSVIWYMFKIPSTLLETEGRHIGDKSFVHHNPNSNMQTENPVVDL